jgi:hypothetical protein
MLSGIFLIGARNANRKIVILVDIFQAFYYNVMLDGYLLTKSGLASPDFPKKMPRLVFLLEVFF